MCRPTRGYAQCHGYQHCMLFAQLNNGCHCGAVAHTHHGGNCCLFSVAARKLLAVTISSSGCVCVRQQKVAHILLRVLCSDRDAVSRGSTSTVGGCTCGCQTSIVWWLNVSNACNVQSYFAVHVLLSNIINDDHQHCYMPDSPGRPSCTQTVCYPPRHHSKAVHTAAAPDHHVQVAPHPQHALTTSLNP